MQHKVAITFHSRKWSSDVSVFIGFKDDGKGRRKKGPPRGRRGFNKVPVLFPPKSIRAVTLLCWGRFSNLPLLPPGSKITFSQQFKDKCISDVVRIGSIIPYHLSKLWKAKFFILCDVISLVRLQENMKLITLGSERVTSWLFAEHGWGFQVEAPMLQIEQE